MEAIVIKGTGSYAPEAVLTNDDVARMVDTSDEWIVQRTGIRERRVAASDQATSDLAAKAAERAMAAAGLEARDLDLIVLSTITPDTQCPSGANWLQAKLGAKGAVSFDVTAACSGFIFALAVARQFLVTGTYGNALVVAAEVMSRTVNWKDRASCILWGDAAGAVVLAKDEKGPRVKSVHLHTDGEAGSQLLLPGGGSATTPISHQSVDEGRHYLRLIEGNKTFKVAVIRFAEACQEAAAANGCTMDQIDWIIPHQANLRIIQAFAKRLDVPEEKVFVNIDKFANSSAATVPLSLDQAVRSGRIRPGQKVILTAFGGGLTWASAFVEWL